MAFAKCQKELVNERMEKILINTSSKISSKNPGVDNTKYT